MIHKPNSRYFYTEQVVANIDIAEGISKIDKLVNESNKLQLANNEIILEFKTNPHDEEFSSSIFLVGREILGYDSEIFSLFKYKDLNERKVKEISIELHSNWIQLFEDIENHLIDKAFWRLLIKDDFSKALIEID